MATAFIKKEKLERCNRYANLLRRTESRYAFAYIAWLRNGAVGIEPTPQEYHVSKTAGGAIKQNIDAMKLWEGAEI